MKKTNKLNMSAKCSTWNCAYHPNERITNFCQTQECLLPLCPQCVKVHQQQHFKTNTYGEFQVIDTIVNNTKDQLERKIKLCQKMHSSLLQIRQLKDNQLKETLSKLRNYKEEVLAIVNQHFLELENEIKQNMETQGKIFKEQFQNSVDMSHNFLQQTKKTLNGLFTAKGLQCIISNQTDLKRKEQINKQTYNNIQEKASTKTVIKVNKNCFTEIIELISQSIQFSQAKTTFQQISPTCSRLQANKQDFEEITDEDNKTIIDRVKLSQPLNSLLSSKLTNTQKNYGVGMKQEDLIHKLTKTTQMIQNNLTAFKNANDKQNFKHGYKYTE